MTDSASATSTYLPREDLTAAPIVDSQSAIQTSGPPPEEAESHARQMNQIDPYFYVQYKTTATFKWDTSAAANTLLWAIELKPDNLHDLLKYITKMYAVWSGDFDFQTIVAGTGFNGGRLAISWIPPSIDPKSVTSWSTYPYILVDPKMQDASASNGSDFRQVAFHWVDNSYTADFTTISANQRGGYLAIFVAMPLIVTGSGTPYVEVMVMSRCANNFRVNQIIDVPSAVSVVPPQFSFTDTGHPVYPQFKLSELRVSPTTIESWQGIDSLYKLDGKPLTHGVTNRSMFWNVNKTASFTFNGMGYPSSNPTMYASTAREAGRSAPQCRNKIGTEGQILGIISLGAIGGGDYQEAVRTEMLAIDSSDPKFSGDQDYYALCHQGGTYSTSYYRSYDRTNNNPMQGRHLDPAKTASDEYPDIQVESRNGESIVYFCFTEDQEGYGTLATAGLNALYKSGLFELKPSGEIQLTHIFDLKDVTTGHVVQVLRLNPEGFFTANASSNTLIYELNEYELVYREVLPLLTPLPVAPPTLAGSSTMIKRELARTMEGFFHKFAPDRIEEINEYLGKDVEKLE